MQPVSYIHCCDHHSLQPAVIIQCSSHINYQIKMFPFVRLSGPFKHVVVLPSTNSTSYCSTIMLVNSYLFIHPADIEQYDPLFGIMFQDKLQMQGKLY